MRLLLGVIVINLMALALGATSLWSSHRMEIQQGEARSRNVVAAVTGNLGSAFGKVDVALRGVVDELEHNLREGGIRIGEANALIARAQAYVPEIDAIRVANAEGEVFLGPGTNNGLRASYAGREPFALHRSRKDAGLIIGKPVLGQISKKWTVSFSRRFNAPDGSFAGIASAMVTVEWMGGILSRFNMGPKDVIVILDADLGHVVRHPAPLRGPSPEIGRKVASSEMVDLAASGLSGATFQSTNPLDGIPRIVSFQRMANAPFLVVAGFAREDVLGRWRTQRDVAVALLASFILVSSLGGWTIWIIWRREREGALLLAGANERLSDSLREARASEKRFNTMFAASPHALSLNSLADARIVDVNPAYCAITGYAREELVGRLTTDVDIWLHPEQRELLLDEFRRAGRVSKFEFEYRAKDGHIGWVSNSLELVEIDGEKFLLAINEEISDRKRAEVLLTESEQRFRGVFDSVGEGIVIHDAADGASLMVNRRLAEMYGILPDDALGFDMNQMSAGEPPYSAAEAKVWFHKAATEGPQVFEWRARRPHDGSLFWVEVNLRSARLGERDCFIAVVRDIGLEIEARRVLQNQREVLEQQVADRTRELALAKDAAEAANVAKSAFLANMSHEIRTPINAITGMAHLMRRTGVTAQQAERLEKIDIAGRHLLEIVSTVLDLSRIEAGHFALDETEISVAGIMASVAAMVRGQAEAKKLELVVEDASLPEHLLGDPIRLKQALFNYANNAVKFTARGSVRMRARVKEEDAESSLVRFEVQDTGVGIAPDVIPRLFSAFEQADNSITRGYGGTGLGLAVARKFAQLMGGDAGVASTPGVGSTFWLTVRLSKGKAPFAPGPQPGAAETRLALDFGGRRVLLVEDEPVNREVTMGLLEDVDLLVHVAADGVEAVQLASINEYDLILMDMQMPRMDGLEATRRIRQLPSGAVVPILAMTANAFAEDRRRCMDAGMDDFITKPVDPETLFSVILNWLSNPPAVIVPEPAATRDEPVSPPALVAEPDKAILLIVDDSPENLVVLNELLRPCYRVALRAAASEPRPDLMLLDVMMPGMDGYTVLEHLRANPATADIPVIFLTALADDPRRGARPASCGAADYITKPIKPAVVLARVRTQLDAKQARDWLKDQNASLEAEVAAPHGRERPDPARQHPGAGPSGRNARSGNRQPHSAHPGLCAAAAGQRLAQASPLCRHPERTLHRFAEPLGAPARHRQGRDSRPHPAQARASSRPRSGPSCRPTPGWAANAIEQAERDIETPLTVSLPGQGNRPLAPREVGRQRLPRRHCRQCHPDRGAPDGPGRRVRRAHLGAGLQSADELRRGPRDHRRCTRHAFRSRHLRRLPGCLWRVCSHRRALWRRTAKEHSHDGPGRIISRRAGGARSRRGRRAVPGGACPTCRRSPPWKDLVVPALEQMGSAWQDGSVALSQVYMAGRFCEELVERVLPPSDPDRKHQPRSAIVLLNDYHMLGKRIVYSVMRASGFELFDYGRMDVMKWWNGRSPTACASC
jgi:PAS domain S-box-containing protein